MKKHITYIVLALLLVICLAPATVMAEGEETSEVTSIEVTIKPILGAIVGTSSTQNIAATHIKSFSATPVERTKGELTLYSVTWYKISDVDYTGVIADDKTKMKEITDKYEIFQDDYRYYVVVEFADYLKDTDWYLPFAKTVTGTIKDGEAVSSALLSDNLILSIEGYVDVKGIYDIDMTITAPSLGAKADYDEPDFTVTDDVCEENSGLGVITVDTEYTKWWKVKEDDYKGIRDSTWEIMEKDEEYTTGYYYMVDLCIYVTNNKEYNWLHRKLSTHLTGSLNGKDFDEVDVMEGEESALLCKIFNPLVETAPTPTPVDDYTPPETGVYGPEDNSQSNNFAWMSLLLVGGGAIAVSALANKKRKYTR